MDARRNNGPEKEPLAGHPDAFEITTSGYTAANFRRDHLLSTIVQRAAIPGRSSKELKEDASAKIEQISDIDQDGYRKTVSPAVVAQLKSGSDDDRAGRTGQRHRTRTRSGAGTGSGSGGGDWAVKN